MVVVEFSGNSLFQKALKDAFEVFINKESSSKYTNAELISTYCDRLLKGGMCVTHGLRWFPLASPVAVCLLQRANG